MVPSAAPIAITADRGEHEQEADDAEAGLSDDVLAPRLLEELARPLERRDHADVLEHEDRDGEERDEAPREADQRGDDPSDDPGRSSWLRMSDTVADTIAHGSSRCSRELATTRSPRGVGVPPRSRTSAPATSAARK